MPIVGLTDNVIPRFQRIGKLRKGGEKTAKGYGADLDHFRFTSDRPEIVKAFHEVYGKEPRLLRVFIPQRKMIDAFPSWCELWSASGLQHRCDGQTMFIWREGDKFIKGSRECSGGHDKNDPKNDSVGRLDVIVPELVNAGYVGYVTLETHSIHDILHISGVLKAVEESRGDLRGVEFSLRRVQEKISTPGFGDRKGERSRVDKWLVKIEPAADWVRVQIESARSEALMLTDPSTVNVVDGETGEVVTVTKQLPEPKQDDGDVNLPKTWKDVENLATETGVPIKEIGKYLKEKHGLKGSKDYKPDYGKDVVEFVNRPVSDTVELEWREKDKVAKLTDNVDWGKDSVFVTKACEWCGTKEKQLEVLSEYGVGTWHKLTIAQAIELWKKIGKK